jgi:hypothetical protein
VCARMHARGNYIVNGELCVMVYVCVCSLKGNANVWISQCGVRGCTGNCGHIAEFVCVYMSDCINIAARQLLGRMRIGLIFVLVLFFVLIFFNNAIMTTNFFFFFTFTHSFVCLSVSVSLTPPLH